ncbi:MAG: 2-oxoacid:acceptor oxidoreductase family protein, partial [Dechloromonas sp.]|nr:2-oxoacid:acceptor oxidoreductase family protein [Dechloromonas sp.]
SPQIAPGEADVLLAFEAAEGLRWMHMLRPGAAALVNDSRFVPPVVELGLYDYPSDPVGQMKAGGRRVVSFDATTIAQGLGDIRLGNTVMLGAIADQLPFSADVLLDCVLKRFQRKGEKVVALNRQAFESGRAAVGAAEAAIA